MSRTTSLFHRANLLLCLAWAAAASAQTDLADGLSIVTSRQGNLQITSFDGRKINVNLHAVQPLTNTRIQTGKSESLFLSLSNGTAIGVDAHTNLSIEHFLQRPYPPSKESNDFEPSSSRLLIKLKHGSLAIAAKGLSPLSKVIVELPNGEVQIHSSIAHIHYDSDTLRVYIADGNLTYTYPNSDEREVLAAPRKLQIRDRDALAGRNATLNVDDEPDERTALFLRAVEHSSQRVIYKVHGESPSIPQPVLVANPVMIDQASPRPYNFLD